MQSACCPEDLACYAQYNMCTGHYVLCLSVMPSPLLQVVKALSAADTAYSAVSSKGTTDSTLAGKDATLVALVQVNLIRGILPPKTWG